MLIRCFFVVQVAALAGPKPMVRFCGGHSRRLSHRAISGCEVSRNSRMSRRGFDLLRGTQHQHTLGNRRRTGRIELRPGAFWLAIFTAPAAAGCRSWRPISTDTCACQPAPSWGGSRTPASMPAFLAASTTRVPSGTSTCIPSIVNVIIFAIFSSSHPTGRSAADLFAVYHSRPPGASRQAERS
jgi:hypothetical protein